MCVDLSKAKPGMVAKFRCGGEALIDYTTPCGNDFYIKFKNSGGDGIGDLSWTKDGFTASHKTDTIFDIIELVEPEFDWSTVKPGMAFRFQNRVLRVQKGDSANGYAYEELKGNGWIGSEAIKEYERAPEHDIEVK